MPDEPNWRDSLSDDLKDHKTLADIKDVGGLAKSFVDTMAAQGQMIRIPGPDAGDEATKAFHLKLSDKVPGLIPTPDPDNAETMNALFKRMGRPDDPVGYDHPDNVDATKMGDFAKKAHELGLTKSQYMGLVETVGNFATSQSEAAAEAQATAVRELKQEWGIVYEDNIQLVDSVMKGTGAPKEMMELAASGQLPPEATRWLYNIGKQLGTEGINFDKDESTTRLAPAEAAARADEIMADRTGPYWNASDPQHKAYVQRVVDLKRAAAAGNF